MAVTRRFTGISRASHSIASYVGALVLNVVRQLAGGSSRWDGRPGPGAATAEISPTGLQLDLCHDVDPVQPARAALQGHYRWRPLAAAIAGPVPARYVNLAVGVAYSP